MIVLGIILVVVIGGFIGLLYYKKKKKKGESDLEYSENNMLHNIEISKDNSKKILNDEEDLENENKED